MHVCGQRNDVNRKHKVAIKIISKKKAPEDFLVKFLPREIDVIKVLKHPSLIAFYQVIETTTRYFIIMELGSTDLLDYIREKKTSARVSGRGTVQATSRWNVLYA